MSVFTNQFPILQENTTGNQKHLILSDTRITGASVNPAVEYVENYNSEENPLKGLPKSSVEIHDGVIYYPKIYTTALTLNVNDYLDDSSEDQTQYINPYTEYYIINPNEYYCRKLNMTDNDNYQEVTINLRNNEVQTQIGIEDTAKKESGNPEYFAMVAAVFDPNKFGYDTRLQTPYNYIYTDRAGSNNSYYEFLPGDGKYVDIMHIGLYPDKNNHYYKFYSTSSSNNSINVVRLEK